MKTLLQDYPQKPTYPQRDAPPISFTTPETIGEALETSLQALSGLAMDNAVETMRPIQDMLVDFVNHLGSGFGSTRKHRHKFKLVLQSKTLPIVVSYIQILHSSIRYQGAVSRAWKIKQYSIWRQALKAAQDISFTTLLMIEFDTPHAAYTSAFQPSPDLLKSLCLTLLCA